MKDYEWTGEPENEDELENRIIKMFANQRIDKIEKQIFRIQILGTILAGSTLLHTAKEIFQ